MHGHTAQELRDGTQDLPEVPYRGGLPRYEYLSCGPALVLENPRRLALHQPRQAQQNAFIESFNGRLRDELLNETLKHPR